MKNIAHQRTKHFINRNATVVWFLNKWIVHIFERIKTHFKNQKGPIWKIKYRVRGGSLFPRVFQCFYIYRVHLVIVML